MKRSVWFLVVSVLIALLASACGSAIAPTLDPTPTPTATPVPTPTAVPLPESFKTQLNDFLKAGAKITALSDQGVTYTELRQGVAEAKGEYDLLTATWPTGFPKGSLDNFAKAFKAWDLTTRLWKMKLDESDEPVEPNINGYKEYVAFGGDRLVYDTHKMDFIVEAYRGKKFVPFDENIRILLGIASTAFDQGKTQVLAELP